MKTSIIILLTLLAILIYALANCTFIEEFGLKSFFIGLSPSIIASIIIFLFLDNSNQIKKIKFNEIFEDMKDSSFINDIIDKSVNKLNNEHFNKVDTNKNMGEKYWITHIKNLSNIENDVWFIGSGMSLWLETTYKDPLIEKLKERFLKIHNNKNYIATINIFLVKHEAITKWNDLFNTIINNILKDLDKENKKTSEILLRNSFNIVKISKSELKYSIVKCGGNINVSMRTNNGKSSDSPTMDIKENSRVCNFFMEDLEFLQKKYLSKKD